MIAKVNTIETGRARLGITVADRFRRNRKITRTTRPTVSPSVSLTSWTDSRIGAERSTCMYSFTDGGSCSRMLGSISMTASAIATMLLPGCLLTIITMARLSFDQFADLSFSTPSNTCATSSSRTGVPLR